MNPNEGASALLRRGKASTRNSSSVDITVLIRSIQRVEGNIDCFRRGQEGCSEMECCWRPYCQEDKPAH